MSMHPEFKPWFASLIRWKNHRYNHLYERKARFARLLYALILALAGVMGMFLDSLRGVWILVALNGLSVLVAAGIIFFSGKKTPDRQSFHALILVFLSALIETETQMHDPIGPFYDPRVGYATYLIMLLSVFFFPGSSMKFLLFWILVFFFALIRYFADNFTYETLSHFLVMQSYAVPAFTFTLFMQHYLYQNGIRDIKQRHRIAILQKHLIYEERKSIFTDMHNFLGAGLTDLFVSIEQLKNNIAPSEKDFEFLKRRVLSLTARLQARLEEKPEIGLLQSNFEYNLKKILIRRYSLSGRIVRIKTDIPQTETVDILKGKWLSFISFLTELITNDLKYGTDSPEWTISLKDGSLLVRLKSSSLFSEQDTKGSGSVILRNTALKLDALFQDSFQSGYYQAELIIPGARIE